MPGLPPVTEEEWEAWQQTRPAARPLSSLRQTLLANPPDFSLPETPPLLSGRTSTTAVAATPPPSSSLAPVGQAVNQFGDPELSFAEASAACGPAAAIAFYQRTGRQMTVGEAVKTARDNQLWDPENGMHGPESQQKLLSILGVPTRLEHGVNWGTVQQDVAGGNPVIIDSPGHYWQVLGYRPEDGRYFVSSSGTAYKAGQQWMTPEEMTSIAGKPRSALYLDNPSTPQPSIAASQPQDGDLQAYARGAARRAGIDPDTFVRQIQQESGFEPLDKSGRPKTSPAGAVGVAQIVPSAHPNVDPTNPHASLDYAASLMGSYVAKYGDWPTALAAYNAGPGNVATYGGVPPFEETQRYIQKIMGGQKAPQVTTPIEPASPDLLALTRQAAQQTASLPPFERAPSRIPVYQPPAPKPVQPLPSAPSPELGAAAYGLADDPTLGQSSYDQPYRQPYIGPTPPPAALPSLPAGALSQRPLDGGVVETTYPNMISVRPGATPAAAPPPAPTPMPSFPQRVLQTARDLLPGALQAIPGVGDAVRTIGPGLEALRDVSPASIVPRTLAGEEQIANESRPEYDMLQAALTQYGPDHPITQGAAEAYNARTGAARQEGVYNAAERNPSLVPAELATNIAAGTVAGFVAPGASAGVARNVAGAVLDPGTVGLNLAADVARAGQATGRLFSPEQRAAFARRAAQRAYEESIDHFDAAYADESAAYWREQAARAGRQWAPPRPGGRNEPVQALPPGTPPATSYLDQLPGEVAGSQRSLSGATSPAALPGARPAPLGQPIAARGAPVGWTPDVIEQGGRPNLPQLPEGNPQRVRLEDAARSLEQQAEQAAHLGDTNQELALRRQAAATRSAAGRSTPAPDPSTLFSGATGALAGGYQNPDDQEQRSPQEQAGRMALGFGAGLLGKRVLGRTAETAAREGFAGNVRLAKYPEEVQRIIQNAADANPAAMESARRGVLPDDVVRDLSRYSGIDVNRIARAWQPGQAKNAETLLALREALASSSRDVLDAQRAYRAADTTENLNRLTESLMTQGALQEVVSGTTAEAGRALRQFRQSVQGLQTPEDRLDALLKLAYKNGKKGQLETFLKGIDLEDPVAVANAARTLYNPKLPDLASWLWYNGLLSNPAGRMRDVISSSIATVTYPLERGAAVPFDIAQSKLLGTPRTVYARQVPAEYAGLVAGLQNGWRDALQVLGHGFTAEQARQDLAFVAREPGSVDIAGRTFNIPDRLRAGISMPSRFTAATDAFFGSMDRSAAANSIAIRRASREGLQGEQLVDRAAELASSPDRAMLEEMANTRRYRVWQEGGQLNTALNRLKDVPGLRVIIPFTQTPVNLVKYAAERSPLGAAMLVGEHAGAAAGLTTRPTTAHTSEMLGRAAMGSTIMAGLYGLAQQGLVTGAPPENEAERDAFYRQGLQPYSVKIGDAWHDYRAWAMAPVMGAAASVHEALKKNEIGDASAMFTVGALGISKAMLDQSFMQGLTNFADALNDPGRRGMSFVEGTARSIVPQALQVVARATDPAIRNPEGPVQAITSVIPGLQDTAAPRLQAFGQPRTRPDLQQGMGALNPLRSSEVRNDPVEGELARLQRSGYKVEPGMVTSIIQVGEKPGPSTDVKLGQREKDRYQEIAGKMAYAYLAASVADPRWANTPDREKERYIQAVVRGAREEARKQIIPSLVPRATEQYMREQGRRAG